MAFESDSRDLHSSRTTNRYSRSDSEYSRTTPRPSVDSVPGDSLQFPKVLGSSMLSGACESADEVAFGVVSWLREGWSSQEALEAMRPLLTLLVVVMVSLSLEAYLSRTITLNYIFQM